VYVDNMLVKSNDEANHLDDLKETFGTLQANLDKVKAIIKIRSSRTVKEV